MNWNCMEKCNGIIKPICHLMVSHAVVIFQVYIELSLGNLNLLHFQFQFQSFVCYHASYPYVKEAPCCLSHWMRFKSFQHNQNGIQINSLTFLLYLTYFTVFYIILLWPSSRKMPLMALFCSIQSWEHCRAFLTHKFHSISKVWDALSSELIPCFLFQLNMNGFLSFEPFNPNTFDPNLNKDIIAPLWTNIYSSGNVSYEQATSGPLIKLATEEITRMFNGIKFTAFWVFVATWDNVGFKTVTGVSNLFL